MRNLSFVHHVPSNSEEHEKDSDDDPNIDARHEGMKRRSKLIGKAFCCCEVTVGFSRNGRGNRTRAPNCVDVDERSFVRIPQATWPRFDGAFSLALLGRLNQLWAATESRLAIPFARSRAADRV